jgi:hypothetical protein
MADGHFAYYTLTGHFAAIVEATRLTHPVIGRARNLSKTQTLGSSVLPASPLPDRLCRKFGYLSLRVPPQFAYTPYIMVELLKSELGVNRNNLILES